MYTDTSQGAWRNFGSGRQAGATWQTPLANDTAQQYKHAYLAAAASSDHTLGQLLAEVDRLGLANDTIIVVTSDHGWGEYAKTCTPLPFLLKQTQVPGRVRL